MEFAVIKYPHQIRACNAVVIVMAHDGISGSEVFEGCVPFEGTTTENGSVKEINGDLRWRMRTSGAKSGDGDRAFDVHTFMFIAMDEDNPMEDIATGYPAGNCNRVDGEFMARLMDEPEGGAGDELIAMHMTRISEASRRRFNLRHAH